MTYCLGILLNDGLVFAGDSRTNAGVDNISVYRKLHVFEQPGERLIVVLSAGNLATTQSVLSQLEEGLVDDDNPDGEGKTLYNVRSMYGAAQLVGEALRNVTDRHEAHVVAQAADVSATFLVGGQINGRRMRLFQVYSAGNFIEATEDTPYLQIGEAKYGKPILQRVVHQDMGLLDAAKCAIVSMDSTIRANISVALPLDILVYRKDTCRTATHQRIFDDDPYFNEVSTQWGEGLRNLYEDLPNPTWGDEVDNS